VKKKVIAVVDDEEDILELISHHLTRDGFIVKKFANGRDLLSFTQSVLPDLLILDIMLPGIDGLEICKMLKGSPRTSHTPIIMLTAKGTEADVVVGLELGADDYVVKPFSPRELTARVKSILRRFSEGDEETSLNTVGPLAIDSERFEATIDGKTLNLTTTEFKILELLSEHPGKVHTRDELI